jgi:tetratricopeptide (TPR) repeat protein
MEGCPKYKPTLFDRHGPAAFDYLRAWAYGVMVFGLTVAVITLRVGFHWWTIPVGLAAGVIPAVLGLFVAHSAGGAWKRVMVDGSSTPSVEQYSQQQALVMQGKLDEALASFESMMRTKPDSVDVRIRAAELYARDKGDHRRAAEVFREAQQLPAITLEQEVYIAHRLVDLLVGPLNEPGRALVELRRLIERYPRSDAAARAREALGELKRRHFAESPPSS